MGNVEQRQEQRHPLRMPVTLTAGKKTMALQSEEVSASGLFLRTDSPPPLRGLVRMETLLDGKPFSVFGMVIHVIPPDDPGGHVPGCGVQLYAMDFAARNLWSTFVREVAAATAVDRRMPTVPSAPDPIRRRYERHRAELELRVETVEELYTLYSEDVSKGGLFIRTDLELAPGTELVVRIVHPETQDLFSLQAIVRRVNRDAGRRGLGVEFLAMTERRREELLDFVRSELMILDDADLVELLPGPPIGSRSNAAEPR